MFPKAENPSGRPEVTCPRGPASKRMTLAYLNALGSLAGRQPSGKDVWLLELYLIGTPSKAGRVSNMFYKGVTWGMIASSASKLMDFISEARYTFVTALSLDFRYCRVVDAYLHVCCARGATCAGLVNVIMVKA